MIKYNKNTIIIPGCHKRNPKKLFAELSQKDFSRGEFYTMDIGEDMYVIEQSIWGWWKPRYLIDRNHERAYEIMDEEMNFMTFKLTDIDWPSLENLPVKARNSARELSAQFPTFIHRFENGVAEVSWQLNPDGRYYMDEDGYGMTSDEEIAVYGYIDKEMNMLVKFRYVGDDYSQLKEMRREAEQKLTEMKYELLTVTEEVKEIDRIVDENFNECYDTMVDKYDYYYLKEKIHRFKAVVLRANVLDDALLAEIENLLEEHVADKQKSFLLVSMIHGIKDSTEGTGGVHLSWYCRLTDILKRYYCWRPPSNFFSKDKSALTLTFVIGYKD